MFRLRFHIKTESHNFFYEMNTILLLGNATSEESSLAELLHQRENSLIIKNAHNEDTAIDTLSESKIDLMICNLNLEEHHHLKTLLRLTTAYPHIPCLAITNTVEEALGYGASYCLQTPLDNVKFISQVAEFLELDTRGTIRGIPIHSFLQMLEGEEKTCTLAVSTISDTGLLYIKNGTLIGAETMEFKGEKATFEILAWEDVVIEIKYLDPRKKQDIDKPLIYLIMEAFRLKDEKKTRPEDPTPPPPSKLKHISTIGKPLTIEIGTQFKMSFTNSKSDLVSSMVGMLQDNHIIVTAPEPFSTIKKAIKNRERITIKYIHMGLLCMFKAMILHVIEKPQKLLFLDYPAVIHCREMRRFERLQTDIPCELCIDDDPAIKGKLKELSSAGGLYQTKLPANEILQNIDVHSKLQLQCFFKGKGKTQKFNVIIKNTYKNSSEIRLGMLFPEPPIPFFMEYLKLSGAGEVKKTQLSAI